MHETHNKNLKLQEAYTLQIVILPADITSAWPV